LIIARAIRLCAVYSKIEILIIFSVLFIKMSTATPTSIMTLDQCYIVTLDRQIDDVIPTMDQPMVAI